MTDSFFCYTLISFYYSVIRFVSFVFAGPDGRGIGTFQGKEIRLENEITYLQFLELCAEKVKELYAGPLHTEICTTTKNNGVEMTGLLMKKPGEPIAPNFFLESHFMEWQKGRSSIESIAEGILRAYGEELEKNRKMVDELHFEWEFFKKKVYVRLIGRERNEGLLADIPHEDYLDMAIVYHYVIEISEEAKGALVITNAHLEMLGITKEELRQAALANTMTGMKPVFTGISDMIMQLGKSVGIPVRWENHCNYMYVLGNADGNYGAVSMLFSKELEQFSNQIQSGFFILPSSVHEVILLPDTGDVPVASLSYMVRDINATQVEKTDVLTDSVYYYDREIHTVRRIA